MPKKTDAEILAELEREDIDKTEKLPDPVEPQAASSVASYEQQQAQDDKAEQIINDASASDKVMARLAQLEEGQRQQQKMMQDFMNSLKGFITPKEQVEILEAKANGEVVEKPVIPIGATVSVFIGIGTAPHEREPVYVNLNNGEGRWLPRGQFTYVSEGELEILQNAVIDKQEYPVIKGKYMAEHPTSQTMTLGIPVKTKEPRFSLAVQRFEVPRAA